MPGVTEKEYNAMEASGEIRAPAPEPTRHRNRGINIEEMDRLDSIGAEERQQAADRQAKIDAIVNRPPAPSGGVMESIGNAYTDSAKYALLPERPPATPTPPAGSQASQPPLTAPPPTEPATIPLPASQANPINPARVSPFPPEGQTGRIRPSPPARFAGTGAGTGPFPGPPPPSSTGQARIEAVKAATSSPAVPQPTPSAAIPVSQPNARQVPQRLPETPGTDKAQATPNPKTTPRVVRTQDPRVARDKSTYNQHIAELSKDPRFDEYRVVKQSTGGPVTRNLSRVLFGTEHPDLSAIDVERLRNEDPRLFALLDTQATALANKDRVAEAESKGVEPTLVQNRSSHDFATRQEASSLGVPTVMTRYRNSETGLVRDAIPGPDPGPRPERLDGEHQGVYESRLAQWRTLADERAKWVGFTQNIPVGDVEASVHKFKASAAHDEAYKKSFEDRGYLGQVSVGFKRFGAEVASLAPDTYKATERIIFRNMGVEYKPEEDFIYQFLKNPSGYGLSRKIIKAAEEDPLAGGIGDKIGGLVGFFANIAITKGVGLNGRLAAGIVMGESGVNQTFDEMVANGATHEEAMNAGITAGIFNLMLGAALPTSEGGKASMLAAKANTLTRGAIFRQFAANTAKQTVHGAGFFAGMTLGNNLIMRQYLNDNRGLFTGVKAAGVEGAAFGLVMSLLGGAAGYLGKNRQKGMVVRDKYAPKPLYFQNKLVGYGNEMAFGVRWEVGGKPFGKSFQTLEEAQKWFDRMATDPKKKMLDNGPKPFAVLTPDAVKDILRVNDRYFKDGRIARRELNDYRESLRKMTDKQLADELAGVRDMLGRAPSQGVKGLDALFHAVKLETESRSNKSGVGETVTQPSGPVDARKTPADETQPPASFTGETQGATVTKPAETPESPEGLVDFKTSKGTLTGKAVAEHPSGKAVYVMVEGEDKPRLVPHKSIIPRTKAPLASDLLPTAEPTEARMTGDRGPGPSNEKTHGAAYDEGRKQGSSYGIFTKGERRKIVERIAGTRDADTPEFNRAMEQFRAGFDRGLEEYQKARDQAQSDRLAPYMDDARAMIDRSDYDSDSDYEDAVREIAEQDATEDEDKKAKEAEVEEQFQKDQTAKDHRVAQYQRVKARVESSGWEVLKEIDGGGGYGSMYLHIRHPGTGETKTIRISDHPQPRGRGGFKTEEPGAVDPYYDEADLSYVVTGGEPVDLDRLDNVLGTKAPRTTEQEAPDAIEIKKAGSVDEGHRPRVETGPHEAPAVNEGGEGLQRGGRGAKVRQKPTPTKAKKKVAAAKATAPKKAPKKPVAFSETPSGDNAYEMSLKQYHDKAVRLVKQWTQITKDNPTDSNKNVLASWKKKARNPEPAYRKEIENHALVVKPEANEPLHPDAAKRYPDLAVLYAARPPEKTNDEGKGGVLPAAKYHLVDKSGNVLSEHATKSAAEGAKSRSGDPRAKVVAVKAEAPPTPATKDQIKRMAKAGLKPKASTTKAQAEAALAQEPTAKQTPREAPNAQAQAKPETQTQDTVDDGGESVEGHTGPTVYFTGEETVSSLTIGDRTFDSPDVNEREQANDIVNAYVEQGIGEQMYTPDTESPASKSFILSADSNGVPISNPDRVVSEAFRTAGKSIPTGMDGVQAWALPGKQQEMAKAVKGAQKRKKIKGEYYAATARGEDITGVKPFAGKRKGTKTYTIPKVDTSLSGTYKALSFATARENSRYAINGILIEGDVAVTTDGHRMFVVKGVKPPAKDKGIREVDNKGKLGGETDGNFPPWKDVIPKNAEVVTTVHNKDTAFNEKNPLWKTIHNLRVASKMTNEEAKGVVIWKNPDGTLGFSSSAPGLGMVEAGIQDNATFVAAVDPAYFIEALEFHARMGTQEVTIRNDKPNKPIVTEGRSEDGRFSQTVTMPISYDTELDTGVPFKSGITSEGLREYGKKRADELEEAAARNKSEDIARSRRIQDDRAKQAFESLYQRLMRTKDYQPALSEMDESDAVRVLNRMDEAPGDNPDVRSDINRAFPGAQAKTDAGKAGTASAPEEAVSAIGNRARIEAEKRKKEEDATEKRMIENEVAREASQKELAAPVIEALRSESKSKQAAEGPGGIYQRGGSVYDAALDGKFTTEQLSAARDWAIENGVVQNAIRSIEGATPVSKYKSSEGYNIGDQVEYVNSGGMELSGEIHAVRGGEITIVPRGANNPIPVPAEQIKRITKPGKDYKAPKGTKLRQEPRKNPNTGNWVVYDIRNGTYLGNNIKSYSDAKNAADRHNIRMQESDDSRAAEKAKYPELPTGQGSPGHVKQLKGYTTQSRYLSSAKEVGWIDKPYGHKQAVYFVKGKLVRISEPYGSGNIGYVNEVDPSEYGEYFHWDNNANAKRVQNRLKKEKSKADEIIQVKADKASVDLGEVEKALKSGKPVNISGTSQILVGNHPRGGEGYSVLIDNTSPSANIGYSRPATAPRAGDMHRNFPVYKNRDSAVAGAIDYLKAQGYGKRESASQTTEGAGEKTGGKRRTAEQILDDAADSARQRIKDRKIHPTGGFSRESGGTTILGDAVDMAIIASTKAAKAGVVRGRQLVDLVKKLVEELSPKQDWKLVYKYTRKMLEASIDEKGKVRHDRLETAAGDIMIRAREADKKSGEKTPKATTKTKPKTEKPPDQKPVPNPLDDGDAVSLLDEWHGDRDVSRTQADIRSRNHRRELHKIIGKRSVVETLGNAMEGERRSRENKLDSAMHLYIDLNNAQANGDGTPQEQFARWSRVNPDEGLEGLSESQKELFHLSQNLPEPARKMADQIASENKQIGIEGVLGGALFRSIDDPESAIASLIDNYTARLWKQPDDTLAEKGKKTLGRIGIGRFTKTTSRAKQRSLESILHGWALGKELAVTGAIHAQNVAEKQVTQVIHDRKLIEMGIKSGVLSVTKGEGMVQIDHPNFTKWVFGGTVGSLTDRERESLLIGRGLRLVSQAEAEANPKGPAAGTVFREVPIYADKKLARHLNNIFRRSVLYDVPGVTTITKWNAQLKAQVLFTSLFHHQAGLRSLLLASPAKNPGFLGLSSTIRKAGVNLPLSAYEAGGETVNQFTPELKELVREGMTIGVRQDWEDDLIRQKTKIGKMIDKVSGPREAKNLLIALRDQQIDFLFDELFPRLKTQAAILEFRHALAKNRKRLELGLTTRKKIAKGVALSMNDDFGGLNLERLGRSPELQHIFHLIALAPDWTESNIRLFVKAFTKGEHGQIARNMIGRIIARGLSATILFNFLMAAAGDDDKDHKGVGARFVRNYQRAWHEDKLRWLWADVTPIYHALGGPHNGKRKYFSILGHFLDPIKFVAHPGDAAKHKSSILGRVVMDYASGTDWARRRFTTLPELLGMDNKGLYKASRRNPDFDTNEPISDKNKVFKYRMGDPKGGKLAGQSVTWNRGPSGAVNYPQIPSFLLAQAKGAAPIQVQNLMDWMMGEQDGFDTVTKSVGMMTATTYHDASDDKK